MSVKITRGLFAGIILLLITASCEKDPGEGGNASIYGKVTVRDYNSDFTYLKEEYPGRDVDVFIIYGDDKSVSDRVRTSYDGVFEFKYLRKGTYTIFAYSKDSTLMTNSVVPVIEEVTIEDNKSEVEAPDIIIFN
jgi:hypothetical protein